jgi:hypothetical protein
VSLCVLHEVQQSPTVVDEPIESGLNPVSSRWSQRRVGKRSREIGVVVGEC